MPIALHQISTAYNIQLGFAICIPWKFGTRSLLRPSDRGGKGWIAGWERPIGALVQQCRPQVQPAGSSKGRRVAGSPVAAASLRANGGRRRGCGVDAAMREATAAGWPGGVGANRGLVRGFWPADGLSNRLGKRLETFLHGPGPFLRVCQGPYGPPCRSAPGWAWE